MATITLPLNSLLWIGASVVRSEGTVPEPVRTFGQSCPARRIRRGRPIAFQNMVKDADDVLREPRHVSQTVARELACTIVVPMRPHGREVLPWDPLQILRARRVHNDCLGFNRPDRKLVAKTAAMLRPVSDPVAGCKVGLYPRPAWSEVPVCHSLRPHSLPKARIFHFGGTTVHRGVPVRGCPRARLDLSSSGGPSSASSSSLSPIGPSNVDRRRSVTEHSERGRRGR